MKHQEMLNLAIQGQPVVVCKFVGWEAKETRNGSVISATTILLGRETVSVEEFMPKGTKVTSVARPAFKEDQKLVFVGFAGRTDYGMRGKGALHPYEAAA